MVHTPVDFMKSITWSGDQSKSSGSVSALNISSLFNVSASQFLIRWTGVSTSFRQYLHTESISGLDFFSWYLRPQWPVIHWTSIPTSCLSVLFLRSLLSLVTFCDTFWMNFFECLSSLRRREGLYSQTMNDGRRERGPWDTLCILRM
jgi:hypothetical protein